MIAFIDDNRELYGVEPICKVLPIAPSTYRKYVAQQRDPLRLSARAQRDRALKPEIARARWRSLLIRWQSMRALPPENWIALS